MLNDPIQMSLSCLSMRFDLWVHVLIRKLRLVFCINLANLVQISEEHKLVLCALDLLTYIICVLCVEESTGLLIKEVKRVNKSTLALLPGGIKKGI